MILVISTPQDLHAQAVMKALTARGVTGHRILDLSEFPLRMDLGISMADGASTFAPQPPFGGAGPRPTACRPT